MDGMSDRDMANMAIRQTDVVRLTEMIASVAASLLVTNEDRYCAQAAQLKERYKHKTPTKELVWSCCAGDAAGLVEAAFWHAQNLRDGADMELMDRFAGQHVANEPDADEPESG